MDVETIFAICGDYYSLELEQSLPFIIRTDTRSRVVCFSYVLRACDEGIRACITEVLEFDAIDSGDEPHVTQTSLDLEIVIQPPSGLGELAVDDYALSLSQFPLDVSWDTMRALIEQAEPAELMSLYDTVCTALT